ncbi:MAG: hypothetical protein ABIJ15_01970 [bacterium]
MKRILRLAAVVLMVCSFSSFLMAKEPEKREERGSMKMCSRMKMRGKKCGHQGRRQDFLTKIICMAEELGLSEKQIEEIRKIKKEQAHYLIDRKDELSGLKLKLSKLQKDETGSLDEAKTLIFKINEVKAELQFKQFETRRKVLAQLTAEQKSKFEEMKKGRKMCPDKMKGKRKK